MNSRRERVPKVKGAHGRRACAPFTCGRRRASLGSAQSRPVQNLNVDGPSDSTAGHEHATEGTFSVVKTPTHTFSVNSPWEGWPFHLPSTTGLSSVEWQLLRYTASPLGCARARGRFTFSAGDPDAARPAAVNAA